MASVMDFLIRISGNGSNFRDDVKLDKLSIEELAAAARDRDMNLEVRVHDAAAVAQLESLDSKVDEINRTPINPGGAAGGTGLLAGTIMTFLPTLTPLLAATAGAVGGLASAFTAASVGAVGFGIVAKSNLTPVFDAVKKGGSAIAQLDAEQQNAAKSLQQFETFWSRFTKSFESPVLNVFNQGLKALQTALTGLQPAITSAGYAFGQLFRGLNASLQTRGAKEFFTWLDVEAGPAIISFGTSAGNILKGLGSLMMAFTPLSHSMQGGLVGMTASFAKWAAGLSKSKSFQDFINYVKTNGPLVLKTLGDLATTVGKMLVAMAPAGHVMLQVVDGLAKLLNGVLGVNPLIGQFGGGLMSGIGIMKLLSPLLGGTGKLFLKFAEDGTGAMGKIGKAFKALGGPWGIIIALIIAGVILVITHWKQISAFAKKVWHEVAEFFTGLWNDVKRIFGHIANAIGDVWNGIKRAAKAFWNAEINGWKNIWNGAVDAVKNIFGGIGRFFTGLWNDASHWGENLIHMFGQGVLNKAHEIEDAAKRIVGRIKSFLGFGSPTDEGPGATSDRWAPNLMKMFIGGIKQYTPELDATMRNVLSAPQYAVNANVAHMISGNTSTADVSAMRQTVIHQHHYDMGGVHVHNPTVMNQRDITNLTQQIQRQTDRQLRSIGVQPG